jgi:hypothetical protein
MADWLLLTRGPDGALTGATPIREISGVIRHFGVGAGVATVTYTDDLYRRLVEGASVEVRRNGHRLDTGPLVEITEAWPDGTIKVAFVGDEVVLSDRLVLPDPTRAGDAQTTASHWTRTGVASTVMLALIAEQAGPAAHPSWRVDGLHTAPDPAAGATVTANIRYGDPDLLTELRTLSLASGADLGIRVDRTDTGLQAAVVPSRDVAATIRFSADLRNLASYEFTRTAPTVTDAIVAGQGELTARTQRVVSSTDPITLGWSRRIWDYVDQRDTDAATELDQSGTETLAEGAATVALTCTLRDTEAVAFGRDWQLGDRVTVYVGHPGGPKAEVVDVVREVAYSYGPRGEAITPAIGTTDATALPSRVTQQTLNRIKARVAGLERRT